MHLMKALAVALGTYLLLFLALIISPVIILLGLWIGLSLFAAAFMFFWWLFITHNPADLNRMLMVLVAGVPPMLLGGVLGYVRGLLRARRQSIVSLRQEEAFDGAHARGQLIAARRAVEERLHTGPRL